MSEQSSEQSYQKITCCKGCGKDMWEYTDEAKADGWCITCAPECYIGGVHIDAMEGEHVH